MVCINDEDIKEAAGDSGVNGLDVDYLENDFRIASKAILPKPELLENTEIKDRFLFFFYFFKDYI